MCPLEILRKGSLFGVRTEPALPGQMVRVYLFLESYLYPVPFDQWCLAWWVRSDVIRGTRFYIISWSPSQPFNTVVHCAMADASGPAPKAPASPPTSQTFEPSASTTIMEIVQTVSAPAPPTFVFGTGSSSSSFAFDPPLDGVTTMHRHPKYYMDTNMVIFKVNNHLRMVTSSADHALLVMV